MSEKVIDNKVLDIHGLDKSFVAPPNKYRLSELAKYLKLTGKSGKELTQKELIQFKY